MDRSFGVLGRLCFHYPYANAASLFASDSRLLNAGTQIHQLSVRKSIGQESIAAVPGALSVPVLCKWECAVRDELSEQILHGGRRAHQSGGGIGIWSIQMIDRWAITYQLPASIAFSRRCFGGRVGVGRKKKEERGRRLQLDGEEAG